MIINLNKKQVKKILITLNQFHIYLTNDGCIWMIL
jgi:hypothetical protein